MLVCDDELQIIRALKVILRDGGFEVLATATAKEALDTAAVENPDAAIIDLVLPDGDGVEVCAQLRSWSEMPILVLSAVGEEQEKVRALDAGADDYVTKPFGPRELIARLEAASGGRRRGDDEPVLRADGLELDVAGQRSAATASRGPSDADRVRPAADADGQPRPPAHPRRAADRGLGPGDTQTTSRRCAPTSPNLRRKVEPEAGAPPHPHRGRHRLPLRRVSLTGSSWEAEP